MRDEVADLPSLVVRVGLPAIGRGVLDRPPERIALVPGGGEQLVPVQWVLLRGGENDSDMRVVAAPDKFRGTLTGAEVAAAIGRGWRGVRRDAEIEEVPVADGGDGTLDALLAALPGRRVRERVSGPLGDPVEAELAIVDIEGTSTAVVEMARASGLSLLDRSRRDPVRASTHGTGELLLAAAREGASRVLVCIGGSATTDGGAGMAQAVGIRLLDAEGRDLAPGGGSLVRLARIVTTGLDPVVGRMQIVVATDVDNPLTGPHGAATVYGPQKGARGADIARLDEALRHLGAVIHRDLGIDVRDVPGAGAAGGLGAGLLAFLGARLRPGFEVVADALGLARRLEAADVAVTGEGKFDEQSAAGKAPAGVLAMAREARCRTVLIAGRVTVPHAPADLVYSLADRVGVESAMRRAAAAVEEAAAEAAREIGP